MKKMFFFFTLLLLTIFFSHPVEAHFLIVDHTIGAILHIDPNDEPVAGEQASFFFEFKDKQNKFRPQNCDCTFSISENGKEIFSQPLFQNNQNPSLSNASIFYTFPQRDVYEIKVVGKPFIPQAFQSFTLTYTIRVETIARTTTPPEQKASWLSTHILYLIIGVVIIILIVLCKFMPKQKKRGGKKKDDKKDHSSFY
jgi:hypothetical protein